MKEIGQNNVIINGQKWWPKFQNKTFIYTRQLVIYHTKNKPFCFKFCTSLTCIDFYNTKKRDEGNKRTSQLPSFEEGTWPGPATSSIIRHWQNMNIHQKIGPINDIERPWNSKKLEQLCRSQQKCPSAEHQS